MIAQTDHQNFHRLGGQLLLTGIQWKLLRRGAGVQVIGLLGQLHELDGIGKHLAAITDVRHDVNELHVGHNEYFEISVVASDEQPECGLNRLEMATPPFRVGVLAVNS